MNRLPAVLCEYIPAETAEAIRSADLNGVPPEAAKEAVRYCLANLQAGTDWVVLPVANFDCYFGNSNFKKSISAGSRIIFWNAQNRHSEFAG